MCEAGAEAKHHHLLDGREMAFFLDLDFCKMSSCAGFCLFSRAFLVLVSRVCYDVIDIEHDTKVI